MIDGSKDLREHPELVGMDTVVDDITGIENEEEWICRIDLGNSLDERLPFPIRQGPLISKGGKAKSRVRIETERLHPGLETWVAQWLDRAFGRCRPRMMTVPGRLKGHIREKQSREEDHGESLRPREGQNTFHSWTPTAMIRNHIFPVLE